MELPPPIYYGAHRMDSSSQISNNLLLSRTSSEECVLYTLSPFLLEGHKPSIPQIFKTPKKYLDRGKYSL